MTALQAAIFQAFTAALVGGVGIAFIAHAIGIDMALANAIRHPLRTIETAIAVPLSWLPAPRRKSYRKHYQGRHK